MGCDSIYDFEREPTEVNGFKKVWINDYALQCPICFCLIEGSVYSSKNANEHKKWHDKNG